MGILRLLLALSVVAAHCGAIWGFTLVGGQIAVQSFYIISGFYMTLILNEKYIGINNSYQLFISNRFIRLYPIYWTVLITTILVCFIIAISSNFKNIPFAFYFSQTNYFSFGFLTLTNLIIFGQDVVMFLGINPANGNLFFTKNFLSTNPQLYTFLLIPQAWTLGVELMFYLVAPFIVKRGIKTVITIIIVSLVLRFILYDYFILKDDPWTYRFFPTEILFFLCGYLSYHLYQKIKKVTFPKHLNISVLLFCIGITILYKYLPTGKVSFLPFSLKEGVYFGTIILSIPILFNYSKKNPLDNKIGELSYPVYISHMLIFMILSLKTFNFLNSGWIAALFTILFSYVLNVLIASPIEKLRQRRLK